MAYFKYTFLPVAINLGEFGSVHKSNTAPTTTFNCECETQANRESEGLSRNRGDSRLQIVVETNT